MRGRTLLRLVKTSARMWGPTDILLLSFVLSWEDVCCRLVVGAFGLCTREVRDVFRGTCCKEDLSVML